MVQVLEFIFEDFWRFLQFCIILMIIALWKPIDITILTGSWREKDSEDKT